MRVQVYIDEQFARRLDDLVREGKIQNVSGALRWLARQGLDTELAMSLLERRIRDLESELIPLMREIQRFFSSLERRLSGEDDADENVNIF